MRFRKGPVRMSKREAIIAEDRRISSEAVEEDLTLLQSNAVDVGASSAF